MKSLLLFLSMWGAGFAPLWYAAHRMFLEPGDWIGALLVSLFLALGINGLRKTLLERRDANLLARPEEPSLPDGGRVAIVGTFEAEAEPLVAPLSGRECLAYDYEIGHYKASGNADGPSSSSSRSSSEVIDYGGYGLAPSLIRSSVRQVHLKAFPGMEGFPRTADELTIGRAQAYVSSTTFQKQSLWSGIGDIDKLVKDRTGSLRLDWRMTSHTGLNGSFLRERILPVGAQACVIGRYAARDSAVVPEPGWGGVRVIQGTREEGLEFLRAKVTGTWIMSVLFLVLPGPIAFAALSAQENYSEAHNKPTARSTRLGELHAAVEARDVAAVRKALWWGADVNMPNENGYVALDRVQDAGTAAVLIEAGANVEAKDRDGRTPIMWAVYYGKPDVVRLLIEHHARLNETSRSSGQTALGMAIADYKEDIARILREAGAREAP